MQSNLRDKTLQELELMEDEIKQEVFQRIKENLEKEIYESKTKDGKYVCHYCHRTHTCKAGKTKQGKQRYRCYDCKKSTIMERDLIHFSSKKDLSQWFIFLESMLNGDTLDVSAKKANISERTSFRWRHKFLYILNQKMNKSVLSGEVTLDETLFPCVSKNKNLPPNPQNKRGISNQKINVVCAIDNKGNTIIKVAKSGRIHAKTLIDIYDGMIEEGSLVISDSHRSYHQLMDHLKIIWVKIPSKKKSLGEYNLEAINHLHALLKDFTHHYKGVSTKYLQGYCALFQFVHNNKHFYEREQFYSIILDLFSSLGHIKCSYLDSNLPIYAL